MLVDIAYLLRRLLRLLTANWYLRGVGRLLDDCLRLRLCLRLDGHFLRLLRLTATKKQHSNDDEKYA